MNVKAVTVSPAKGYETTRYAYTLLYIIYGEWHYSGKCSVMIIV